MNHLHQRILHFAIERINSETAFVPHKVTSSFSSVASFSMLDFQLASYTDRNGQVAVQFGDLFKLKEVEDDMALEFIAKSRRRLWPPLDLDSTSTEADTMIALCREIFVPLCREVVLETRYTTRMGKVTGVKVGNIGLGSANTWHGTPDARVRGMDVVWCTTEGGEVGIESDDEGVGQVVSDGGRDGCSAAIEGEVVLKESNLPQAIGTCVTSAFTAKTRHPKIKTPTPTLLIDKNEFRVCLYDCERDLLRISTNKGLATKGGLSRSGMAQLWLVINHR